jgi:hypothetical protein
VVVGSIGDNLRMDYSAIGDTTNLAARLQQIAEPDTILLSASTYRLVQGDIRLEALAPVQVRGLAEPITPYKILGTLPRRSPVVSRDERPLSRFVGRERELDVCFVNSLPVPWERRRPACFRSGLEARAPRRPYTGTGLVKWTSSHPGSSLRPGRGRARPGRRHCCRSGRR